MNLTLTTWYQWVIALIVGLVFFIVFSAGLGFWSYTRPVKITSQATPADFGLEYEEVNLTTSDDVQLAAWFVPAKKQTDKAILLLHGYPADKGNILPSTLFLADDYNLLYLDFRFLGQSSGRFSTAGVKERLDVLAGVKYLKNDQNIERVGIWGFSAGAAAGLMALPETPDIDAVVSETSYASLKLMAFEIFPVPVLDHAIVWTLDQLARLVFGFGLETYSPEKAAAGADVPILFIHSRKDQVIPFPHAQALQEASSKNPHAEFWFRQAEPHGFIGTSEYQERVKSFFERNL